MTSPSGQDGAAPRRTWRQAAFATSARTLWREWRERRAAVRAANPAEPRSPAAVVRAAHLPEPLGRLVETTARRTRLRRRERCDIARELVRHVRDGLDAGVAPADLAATFGDPGRTARLLRSATIAKRSLVDRGAVATLRWGGLALGTLAAVYLVVAARLWMLEPRIAFDPVERMNALMPQAPEAERAWPRYREAMRWIADWRMANVAMAAKGDGPWWGTLDPKFDEALREGAIADMEAHSDELAALRAAAAMPVLGAPLAHGYSSEDAAFFGLTAPDPRSSSTASGPATKLLLQHLTTLRSAARWLAGDAWLAAQRGDGLRAVDDLVAILNVARHAGESRFLVAQLTQSGIVSMATGNAIELLERHAAAFTDVDLVRLDAKLAAIPDSTWRPDFAAERVLFEDALQRAYSDDGEGDGVLLPERASEILQTFGTTYTGEPQASNSGASEGDIGSFLASPLAAALVAGRRDELDRHQALLADVESRAVRPLWHLDATVDPRFLPESGERRKLQGRHTMVDFLAPALGRLTPALALTRARVDALRTAIALTRFNSAEGRWPDALDQLLPRFIATIPVDPYDGQPLRYALRDGRPILWFVGGDRTDDGGRPAAPAGSATSAAADERTWRMFSSIWVPPSEVAGIEPWRAGDWIVFVGPEEVSRR